MVLTSNKRLGPDIWAETSDHAKDIVNIIRMIWAEEAHCQQKADETKICLLFPFGKETRHISSLISYFVTIWLLNRHRFWIQL